MFVENMDTEMSRPNEHGELSLNSRSLKQLLSTQEDARIVNKAKTLPDRRSE